MRLILTALFFALPGAAFADTCDAAWREGYLRGVADIQQQLTQSHAQMQAQVEAQLNAQLAQLQTQRDDDLKTQLRAAQQAALDAAVAAPMPSGLTGKGDAAPAPPPSLLIQNPQNLPPELYAALMAYVEG